MEQARRQQPYHAKVLNNNFFSNFEQLPSNIASIRTRTKASEAIVDDIRCLKYYNGEILYKLRHLDAWIVLQKRISQEEVRLACHLFRFTQNQSKFLKTNSTICKK